MSQTGKDQLELGGVRAFDPKEGIEAFEKIFVGKPKAEIAVMAVDWSGVYQPSTSEFK